MFRSVPILLLSLCLAAPAFTDDLPQKEPNKGDPEKDAPRVEETMVVTATRSERGVSELPVSTTVISEEKIRTAPSLWTDDIIRTIPGVHAVMSGSAATIPSRQRFSMHGLGGNRALVLLDGIPIHDPFVGTVQWQKVPLDTIEQIEVVRGGNASLFGNSALGGTINLITRPVTSDEIRAETAWGNGGTDRQVLTVDHEFSSRMSARLNHFRHDSNGYRVTPQPGPIDIPAWNDTTVTNARVDFRPSDALSMYLRANVSSLDISAGTFLSNSSSDVVDLAGVLHRTLGTGSLLSVTVFNQDESERILGTNSIGARESEYVSNDATSPVTSTGASVEWSTGRTGPLAFLSFGVDVSRISASEHRKVFNRSGAMTQEGEVEGRQQFGGAFAQASWRPAEPLEILASARVDYYRNSNGVETIFGGATTEYPESSSTQFDPRLSVRYATSQRSALRGSVYRAFKAPTLRELYRTSDSSNTIILGNPYLGPETLVGGEVGFEWALPRARFEVNLYRSDIEGLRARAPVPGQPPNVLQQMNLGSSRSQGVEAMADVRLSRSWSVNAGYTYADAKVTDDPDPALEGKLIPEVVPHIGSLTLRYRNARGASAEFRGRVLSTSYAEASNTVPSPAHRVLDVSASYPLLRSLSVFAVLENAFDEKYYYAVSTRTTRNGQPRTFTAGLRFTLGGGDASLR